MFEFLTVTDAGIEILPHALVEPELKAVFDRDRTKGKTRAKEELLYITSVANFGSPYFHWTEAKQNKELGIRIFGKPFSPDKKVTSAIEALLKLQEDSYPAFRYYRTTQKALDKLTSLVETFDPSLTDSEGRPLLPAKELFTFVKEAYPMSEQLNLIREKIIQQNFSKSRTKADRDINPFEK